MFGTELVPINVNTVLSFCVLFLCCSFGLFLCAVLTYSLSHLLECGEPLLVLLGERVHVEARSKPNRHESVESKVDQRKSLVVESKNCLKMEKCHCWKSLQ